jgi:hypothetical protein
MGNVEDVRKVIQDFVAPDLKALSAKLEAGDAASKQRDESLSTKIDALSDRVDLKFEAVLAKMDLDFKFLAAKIDANHATVMNALTIDKRLDALERGLHKEPSHA